MNTRMRVKAVPALLLAGMGINTRAIFAHTGHQTAASPMPEGLEELSITIEEDGVTGMPESIEAGRYLIKVGGPEPGEMGPAGVVFAQLPEGVTAESAYEEVLANPDDMPGWYLDTHFGGGVQLSQGTESWVVLDFAPGEWVVTTLYGSTLGVEFEVTGELPADLPAVESNVTLTLHEMVIRVSEGEFVAGDNIIRVVNDGAQIHFVDIGKLPDGTTKEQVDELMNSFMTGTPVAEGGLGEQDMMPVAYLPDVSHGVTETLPLTLEPGTYGLFCWAPDPETMMPHAMMGMYEVITIS